MWALLASALLTLYIVVPEVLFLYVFGRFVPLRSIARSRVEEVSRSLFTLLIPFSLALLASWYIPPTLISIRENNNSTRRTDYLIVTSTIAQNLEFKHFKEAEFRASLTRVSRRQFRLLVFYYGFTVLVAITNGWIAKSYGRLRTSEHRILASFADRYILPKVSQWYALLTPFTQADKKTLVRVDVLTSNDTLFRGEVFQHYVDGDGRLIGLLLKDAERFDRQLYLKHKDGRRVLPKESYWRVIPGSKRFYIFAEKIVNINFNYESPEQIASVIATHFAIQTSDITVELSATPKKPDSNIRPTEPQQE
jgi:hypothetical protein